MNRIQPLVWLLLFAMVLPFVTLGAHAVLPADTMDHDLRFTETNPPAAPVRPIAEFEPASHVLIRYPLGIPVALVAHLSNTAQVICLVSSTSQQNTATNTFNNGGVNMSNVSFMIAPTDSYWTRDFGPWFIMDGNDQVAIVDFVYNRPRPNDNMIPQTFATQQNFTYYGMNVQQTGGNYMSDGINTAAQTTLVYEENTSLGQTGVSNKMLQYMGASNYYVINDPNNTYIDHIDCWAKFLAPDKVLVRSVPTSHAQYAAIEQAANYFATRNCAWGYPWKVYRVNTPQNQPYTNSLILNHKVFVPIMNSSYDAAALQVYRNALPGYEVIGISSPSSTPWESTDALHCRTHEIADKQMLHITHMPVWGQHNESETINFNARIKAYSGQALYSDSLKVMWKVNQAPWESTLLQDLGSNNFTAMLAGFAAGDTVRYYIHAADASGRSIDHPLTGAHDPHIFSFYPDQVPPVIQHTPPVSVINQDSGPITFSAQVSDNVWVQQVLFSYYSETQPLLSIPMTDADGIYTFEYYPEFTEDDHFLWYQITATDTANPPNQAVYPAPGEWQSIPLMIVDNDDPVIPEVNLVIQSVYPNPFRPTRESASVAFKGKAGEKVSWSIFNIRGQKVSAGLSTVNSDGDGRISWNGKGPDDSFLPAGIYLLRLSQSGSHQSRKLIIGL
ncbi:MAG TPA: agmatine deiminase family protein [Candidatus Cloacimonadota bacterium]|nr:agmatine deiminase family protein [Candidatus Cloacimonadota bacterium]